MPLPALSPGRFRRAALVGLLSLWFGCPWASAQFSSADDRSLDHCPSPWAMRHANAARTGQSSSQGPHTGQVDWRQLVGGQSESRVVDCEGNIYLGTVFHEES